MQIIVILQFHGLPYKVLLRNRYTCGRMVKLGGARKPIIIGIPGRMVKLGGVKKPFIQTAELSFTASPRMTNSDVFL